MFFDDSYAFWQSVIRFCFCSQWFVDGVGVFVCSRFSWFVCTGTCTSHVQKQISTFSMLLHDTQGFSMMFLDFDGLRTISTISEILNASKAIFRTCNDFQLLLIIVNAFQWVPLFFHWFSMIFNDVPCLSVIVYDCQ